MKKQNRFGAKGLLWLGAALIGVSLAQAGCGPSSQPPRLIAAPPALAAPSAPRLAPEPLPELIVTEIEGKREPERLYSLSLRDAEFREVLMALAKQTNFNFVVDPKLKRTVTVDLRNVTFTQVLDTLADLADVNYTVKQNIIRVFEPVPETRIFALQYVNLKRTGSTATSAQIGTSSGVSGSVVAGTTTPTGVATGQTTLTTTTETDLWREIEAGVAKMLTSAGKMVVDRQGGNILVTDLPKNLERIASLLETIEGSVQRQVLIEARIVEVTLTGEYRFGLDWSAIAKAGALRGASTIAPTRIIGQKLAAPSRGEFQFGVTSTDFASVLSVLNKQGEINVLSGPKLATLNNQTALIRSATDEVFFERRVIETFVNGTPRVTTEVTPRTVTVGVVLAVTPQVGGNGDVVLHIRPTVTERTGVAEFREGQTVFTAPILDVREADVVVRAREGQIVVIGGLMQEKRTDDENKVPLLGDMPGVGRLFRSTTQERRKTELVVLLSPTVLVGKKVDDITSRELERLNKTRGRSPW
jgi:MSHA biogenesis protein MshL